MPTQRNASCGVLFYSSSQMLCVYSACLRSLLINSGRTTCRHDLLTKSAPTFKTFLEVRLNIHGILGLSKNLQQVVTGEEVEARELLPLVFQVVFQAFLDALQLAFKVCEAVQHAWSCTCLRMQNPRCECLLTIRSFGNPVRCMMGQDVRLCATVACVVHIQSTCFSMSSCCL